MHCSTVPSPGVAPKVPSGQGIVPYPSPGQYDPNGQPTASVMLSAPSIVISVPGGAGYK